MPVITLEDVKKEQEKLAEMIAAFEAKEKAAAAYPITITFPDLKEGETYIGVIGDAAGNLHHVVLLPGDNDDSTWQSAMDWAQSIGGDLPNRIEQAMLWAGHKDQFQRDWYWTRESYECNAAYAWFQNFLYGYQYGIHKDGNRCRARAVRRLPI